MNYDFITVGGATEDITFYTSEGVLIDNKKDILRQKLLAFEYGAKLKVDKSYSTYGGGAANASVSLSKIGFRTACLTAVGEDVRGEGIISNFKKNKVDTLLIQRIKNIESGFSFLLRATCNEHVVFSNRAANGELKISNKEIKELQKTKWIYITSLSGKWLEVLKKIFSLSNKKIAWNPGHTQFKAGYKKLSPYLKNTFYLSINKDEAIELVISHPAYKKKANAYLNKTENLLKVIKSWGPKIVVITSGEKGADAYDGRKLYFQAVIKEVRREDTTGVGDSFGSTFTAGLEIFNGDIAKAMKVASANAASVISQRGAQNGLLTKRQLLKYVR